LTRRELEVLAAMADGASNKAIARRLGISFHTAKFHVAAILAKLDADSRTEAVAKAAQLGLVMLWYRDRAHGGRSIQPDA
jgi:DNA-binding NarL/FixJ family response regulator